jgi:mitochondrial fission protein ELM1
MAIRAMTLVVWAFSDGKPGHESQTRGLLLALAQGGATQSHWIPAVGSARWRDALARRYPAGDALPDPQLLIGAGHATHLPMLLARRARGGRVLVLMRPSLPLRWFDLCVVPAHDRVATAPNVLITRGALNAVVPGSAPDPGRGLILIGGPSRHYAWRDEDVVRQVAQIAQTDTAVQWTLTTSRRTPARTMELLQALHAPKPTLVPYAQTDRAWLPAQLSQVAQAWVTEDSVSMVYEALTAGAATGLLRVPGRRTSRVGRGVDDLVRDGLVTEFSQWQQGARLTPPATHFNEAARVAAWVRNTWFPAL